jgi:FtsH ternary system domain X2
MCNPRRVRVTAARNLAEAWQHEVRRRVRRTGRAVGRARIVEPLGATLGLPTLAALAGVLARTPGWERGEDGFRHELDGGYLRYDPAARELEIVATAEEDVEVAAEAATTVAGEVTGTVEAEGVGTYYDDGWGGLTAEDARRAADRAAAASLDAAVRLRLDQARREADDREGDAVLAEARARADAALAQAADERTARLRADAAARLTAVGIQGRTVFHQALGSAYRDAILAFARSRGADAVRCTEQGGTVDIEFELDLG